MIAISYPSSAMIVNVLLSPSVTSNTPLGAILPFAPAVAVIVCFGIGIFIVYLNVSTLLSCIPSFTAIALIVVSTLCPASPDTVIGVVYFVPLVLLGVVPSVV